MRTNPNPPSITPVLSLVGTVGLGAAMEQGRVFFEYVPSNLVDVVRKTLQQVAGIGTSEYDTPCNQCLDDAIVNSQRIGAGLLGYVEPENLLFVFSESAKALMQLPLEAPLANTTDGEAPCTISTSNHQQADAQQKCNANSLAIVLCQISDAQPLSDLIGRKDDQSERYSECYQVTWCELEKLQQWLKYVSHSASVGQGGAQ